MHACLLIREMPWYRRSAFEAGLRSVGYMVDAKWRPAPDNVLVIWNRYGNYDHIAREYEKAGGRVIVAENGYLGREWNDGYWYAVSRALHNTRSDFQLGDESRISEIGITIEPWRKGGKEIVILETRGIGPNSVREPLGWSRDIFTKLKRTSNIPVRIRKHPGENKNVVSLYDDLKDAYAVVTWGSGGALKAITWGIPVFFGYPGWIGAESAHPLSVDLENRYTGSRMETLRRIAWGMWNTTEIERGAPFTWLLR